MRICMIASAAFPPQEGMGFYIWNLSKQLTQLGHEVQIITRGAPRRTTHTMAEGISIWAPPFLPIYPFHVHGHSRFVNRLVQKLEPATDLFHLHTPLVKFPKTKRPTLVTVHTPMRADVGSFQPDSLVGWLAKLQAPVSYLLEQESFDRAQRLTAVSRSVAGELEAYGVVPETVSVLGNGVNVELFRPKAERTAPPKPYFLTVARLAPRKGLRDLVACAETVARHYPTHRFLVAGTGPLASDLKRDIEARGLQERVILLGHVGNRQQLIDLYQNATAFVHPAHYEGLPTVLLEAMACGCPAVATAVSGALDVVQDGENGLLVPVRNPKAMAGAIGRLIENPALCRKLGTAARNTIEARYAWRVVGRQYVSEYARVLEGAQS